MNWWQDTNTSSIDWYRSWPREIPKGRAHVRDSLPRLPMTNCDYRTMQWPDEGFCLLEWDIALDRRQRATFADQAAERPDEVLVAPYWLFYGGSGRLVHRKLFNLDPIAEGAPTADLFGFGCVYFPRQMILDYLAYQPYRREPFTDTTFSHWHRRTHGKARVTWDVHPQHLHGD
jgi:hypothetical protein